MYSSHTMPRHHLEGWIQISPGIQSALGPGGRRKSRRCVSCLETRSAFLRTGGEQARISETATCLNITIRQYSDNTVKLQLTYSWLSNDSESTEPPPRLRLQ